MMSKRKIEAALRRKGLSCSVLEYGQHICPGEIVSAWTIELDGQSEELIFAADPNFDDYEPDCFNTEEALEWVQTLPDCSKSTRAALAKEGE